MENQPTSCNSRCRSNLCKGVGMRRKFTIEFTTPKHTKTFDFVLSLVQGWRIDENENHIQSWLIIDITCTVLLPGGAPATGGASDRVFSVISCSGREMQGGVARCYAASQCNLLHDWMVSRTCTHLVKLRLPVQPNASGPANYGAYGPWTHNKPECQNGKERSEGAQNLHCPSDISISTGLTTQLLIGRQFQHAPSTRRFALGAIARTNPGWAYSREAVVLFMTMTMTMIMAMMATMMGDDDGDDVDDDVDDE